MKLRHCKKHIVIILKHIHETTYINALALYEWYDVMVWYGIFHIF